MIDVKQDLNRLMDGVVPALDGQDPADGTRSHADTDRHPPLEAVDDTLGFM